MNRFLGFAALLLIVFWMIGTFVFVVGKIVHVLLVLAISLFLLRMVRRKRR